VRVPPVLELRRTDVARRAFNPAAMHVAGAGAKLARRIAHRGAPIAAPAGLVEEQLAVLDAPSPDELPRNGRGGRDGRGRARKNQP